MIAINIIVEKLTERELMRKACSFTINQASNMTLDKIYRCVHSPIRTQMFTVEMIDIPTFVSVHFVRHKHGVEHYVRSNRDDRGGNGTEDRNTPVNHLMLCNAQALINMARKRLCSKAHKTTVEVMAAIKSQVSLVDPTLAKYLIPECEYRNGCHEQRPCGHFDRLAPVAGGRTHGH